MICAGIRGRFPACRRESSGIPETFGSAALWNSAVSTFTAPAGLSSAIRAPVKASDAAGLAAAPCPLRACRQFVVNTIGGTRPPRPAPSTRPPRPAPQLPPARAIPRCERPCSSRSLRRPFLHAFGAAWFGFPALQTPYSILPCDHSILFRSLNNPTLHPICSIRPLNSPWIKVFRSAFRGM